MGNIETLIKKMIDIHVKDVDVYLNKGSLWLIFTEEEKWVIELDKHGNLWYNYYFFSKIFQIISMDLLKNQHYITRWVEDTIQNGVKHTFFIGNETIYKVEDAIQNGVKYTTGYQLTTDVSVEDAILNGVKMVVAGECERTNPSIEDIIKSGVKNRIKNTWTNMIPNEYDWSDDFNKELEDVIQNGVKI